MFNHKHTFILVTYVNDKRYKPVIRKTKKGVSDYVNRMFLKYGDDTIIKVAYIDENFTYHDYTTYTS